MILTTLLWGIIGGCIALAFAATFGGFGTGFAIGVLAHVVVVLAFEFAGKSLL